MSSVVNEITLFGSFAILNMWLRKHNISERGFPRVVLQFNDAESQLRFGSAMRSEYPYLYCDPISRVDKVHGIAFSTEVKDRRKGDRRKL